MRRRLRYVLAWSLATMVAVTGSWVGLQPLLVAASPELPTRLSASQLRDAAPITPSPVPPASESPSPSPDETDSEQDTPDRDQDPAESQPQPPQALEPATSEWKELADENEFERTFILRGGEVVFTASRRKVEVVDHTANPGYEVSVNRWSDSSVIFSFESVEQTSRIWVMWRNGPYAEVTETV